MQYREYILTAARTYMPLAIENTQHYLKALVVIRKLKSFRTFFIERPFERKLFAVRDRGTPTTM